MILAAKPYWAAFSSSSYIKELTLGNIWVAHGYSSDMYQARADAEAAGRFKVDFALPARCGAGHRQHGDPQGLEEPDLAYRFIDFMLDGRNASELTHLPFIRPEIKTLAALFPDAATGQAGAAEGPELAPATRPEQALDRDQAALIRTAIDERATLGRPLRFRAPPRTR